MSDDLPEFSTESKDFLDLADNVEMREAFEAREMYDIWQSEEEEPLIVSSDPSQLLSIDAGLARGYNSGPNPIVRADFNPANNMPQYVVALIEHHHLNTGQYTWEDKPLAKSIRDLGHQVRGKSIDQCGHIVARCLGGRMERRNLFPIGRNTNWSQYWNAERGIKAFIEEKKAQKGRCLLQVRLGYGDKKYPSRPTRFWYSYVLFSDGKDGKQAEPLPGCPTNIFLEVKVANALGVMMTIQIDEKNVEKSRTKEHCNKASKSTKSKIWEEVAFWSSLGIMAITIAVPDLFAQPKIITDPVPVPVAEPVNVPVPTAEPVPVPAPVPEPANLPTPAPEPVAVPVPAAAPVYVPTPIPYQCYTPPENFFLTGMRLVTATCN